MKAPTTTRVIPWSVDHLELFDLAAPSWRPPETITLRLNGRRTRFTAIAAFTRPDGVVATITSVARKQADGEWINTRETVRIRLGGPVASIAP